MLRLPAAIIDQIAAQAAAGYPAETCGLLFASAGSDTCRRMLPMDNLADRYHAADPAAFPRTARAYFAMNGATVARAVREAEAAGEVWLGIWHSHIDSGAYFSAEDARCFAPDGEDTVVDLGNGDDRRFT